MYEDYCNDYEMFGDPMRDAYDYEEAARYDRFDGWGDPDPGDCDGGEDEPDGWECCDGGPLDSLAPLMVPYVSDDVPF